MTKKLEHLGFIMDGNRRWARERGSDIMEGHQKGYEKFKDVAKWCLDRGIKTVTAFAFSTENWNRPKKEVSYLMKLLSLALSRDIDEFHKKNIRLKVIGRKEGLDSNILSLIKKAEDLTKNNTAGLLQLAVNYGGRTEILDAVKRMIEDKVPSENISEESFAGYLYTAGVSDPDLIIRTSGEKRLSGFLLWQSAYSELLFIDKYWPDLSASDVDYAIEEYARRERRYGR